MKSMVSGWLRRVGSRTRSAKLESLKTAAKGSDTAMLRKEMDDFNEALQKIGQHIYQQAGAATGGSSAAGGEEKKDDVVDADYKEVN